MKSVYIYICILALKQAILHSFSAHTFLLIIKLVHVFALERMLVVHITAPASCFEHLFLPKVAIFVQRKSVKRNVHKLLKIFETIIGQPSVKVPSYTTLIMDLLKVNKVNIKASVVFN